MNREWKPISVSGLHLEPVDNAFKLADKNECLNSQTHDCSDAAICINTPGSFSCECSVGFEDKGDSEFPGRKCEPVYEQHTTEDQIKVNDNEEWKIVAYIMTAFLLIGFPVSVIIIKKKYSSQMHTKVEPDPEERINSAFVVFPETMADPVYTIYTMYSKEEPS